jgi:hypothetical protein
MCTSKEMQKSLGCALYVKCALQARKYGILFFMCCIFFQLDQIVAMLVKDVSNTCSAKTYYINRLTHNNCKTVTMGNRTAELSD